LSPPLLESVAAADDGLGPAVTGRVIGRRGMFERRDLVSSLIRDFTGGEWGRLVVRIGHESGFVTFSSPRWSPGVHPDLRLHVRDIEPDPASWLKHHLSAASRRLGAESADPPSADAAWRIARLRLLFLDTEGAEKAVQKGLDHLERIGGAGADLPDLLLLVKQLRAFRCGEAADELYAYLEDLPA
jgi:hypothetical protein